MVFQIQGKGKYATCPNCWQKTKKKQDLQLRTWTTPLKHIRLSDKREIQILPTRRYFRCNCWCSFLERFDFEAESWLHTKAFEDYVIFARWHMSWLQIARNTSCSGKKIHKILWKIDPYMLNKRWIEHMKSMDSIYIWIDEHSFSWRDMVLVICDIRHWLPIAILEDNKLETLRKWLDWLPSDIKFKMRWVSTDMNKTYLSTVKKVFPNIISTIDKYHLVQEANRMVDDIRQLNKRLLKMNFVKADDIVKSWKVPKKFTKDFTKEEREKLSESNTKQMKKYKDKIETLNPKYFTENELKTQTGKTIDFKEITLDFFLNWKSNYKLLFMKREKSLSWIQRLRLRQILREFDFHWYIWEAWQIKEDFIDALDNKDFEEIERIRKQALLSEHYRVKWFWKTLTRWKTELYNYCTYSQKDFNFTNAKTEANNNVCKVEKRVSYWFRHKANYMRKLSSRFVIIKICFKQNQYLIQKN